ncbi:MAG: hypothetical protein E7572_12515 [Ruminococcaceae bacterium]|jgi:hypothetical protein|nr:hypothetical protein [Oscillospiraceae bacterium]
MADEMRPQEAARYDKEQLLQSARYAGKRDLLTALLEDGRLYSHEETVALLENYLKGAVK